MNRSKIQWEKYPEIKPSLGFGLYPVMLKYGCIDRSIGHRYCFLYYYPDQNDGFMWQEDMICYDDDVEMFIDMIVYPDIAYKLCVEDI